MFATPVGARRRRIHRLHKVVVALALAGAAVTDLRAQCSSGGLNDSRDSSMTWITFRAHYTDDDSGSSDYFTAAQAQFVADGAAEAHAVWDAYFRDPYQNGLDSDEVFHIYVYDYGGFASARADCIGVNAPSFLTSTNLNIYGTVAHELFHCIERRYMCSIPSADCGQDSCNDTFGEWVSEGQAAAMQDHLSLAIDGLAGSGFLGVVTTGANSPIVAPERSLVDSSYGCCLFWKYCCEQYGSVSTEPFLGVDFLSTFWDNVDATGSNASLAHLQAAIAAHGGGTIGDAWQSFNICNYVKSIDLSGLTDNRPYFYVDENQYGEGGYGSVPTNALILGQTSYPAQSAYSTQYYQGDFPAGTCVAVGVAGQSSGPVGWSLAGIETAASPDRLVGLSRQQGREYYRTFFASPINQLNRIGLVVSILDSESTHTVTYGSGPVTVAVQSPTTDQPAYPGLASDPGRFLIRVLVEGPDELTPDGPDSLSLAGLDADDFAVSVGGLSASVYSAAYIGGHYALIVQAPAQSADGLYDMTVRLCDTAATFTAHAAVNYGDTVINHMVILDVSGSMDDPAVGTSKLDAAKIAATMYVDAVSENHRLGVVYFSGDASEPIDAPPSVCNDDATPLAGLDFKDAAERAVVNFFISALAADHYTSIGDGLWKAQAAIESAPTGDINMITLLSDGIENEGRFWHTPPSCAGDAGIPAADRIIPTSTIVNAFAFGAESDQSLLAQIAEETGGVMDYIPIEGSGFRASSLSMTNRLALAYIDALTNAQDVECVFSDFGTVSAPVDVAIPLAESGLADTTFVFNIDDPAGVLNVELRDPTGHLISDPADAAIFSTDTHVAVHLHGVAATGDWTARLGSSSPAQYLAVVTAANRHGADVEFSFYQIRTGGVDGVPEDGFEQGVPVRFVSQPTDGTGPILGASFQVTVELPDGRIACGDYDLRDDGKSGDGEANDGVYGAIFTETAQGSRDGIDNDVINDPPPPPPGAGQPGTYTVSIRASGRTNGGDAFQRLITTGFHIKASLEDADSDGIPDPWELTYGTDAAMADDTADPDEDRLTSREEFERGTHPFDPDTDADGESDGSEVVAGRCPLNAADKQLDYPLDVHVVENDPASSEFTPIPPEALIVRFPWYPEYNRLRVYRSVDTPGGFALLTTLTAATGAAGKYLDTGLESGRTYHYRFEAEAAGARSRYSRIVSGVPAPRPIATQWICGTGNWSTTSCWSTLYGADAFPENGIAHYEVAMQPGEYTCFVDPAAVTINSLTMSDPLTEVRVVGGHSLTLLGPAAGPGKLASIGTGSTVRFAQLGELAGPTIGALEFEAGVNGRIEFPQLTDVTGNVTFHAHNDNGVPTISCPQLDRLSLGTRVRVRSGGTFLGAPLVDIRGAYLEIHSSRSVLDTSRIAALDDARLFIDGGANVSFPLVTSYQTGILDTGTRAFQSKNSSRLSFPALTEIAAAPGAPLLLWAYAGGILEMPALTTMSGPVRIWIDGDGAEVTVKEVNLDAASVLHVGNAEPDHIPGGELVVAGSLHCAITNPLNFAWRGDPSVDAVLTMTGGASGECAALEVAGAERGEDPLGWVSNFQLDRLRIGPGVQVMLIDDADNSAGAAPEALYVETLEFTDASGAIHLNGLNLHYHTLVGSVTQIVAGNCTAACPGDVDGDEDVDLGDLSRLLSNFGTPSGATLETGDLDGDGDVDLGDLSGLLSSFGTSCP